jgi:D-alanyl-D-alanine carboxypeptidase (penicillin-binding protein 5/6)
MKLFLLTALLSLATPVIAAAPPFDTPAPIAFMKDLSTGEILYSKNADQRVPPASLAKMMTVYVALDLISKGELKPNQMITVRPETWQKWHAQGSTMFLSPGEQVSVENLLYGIITLSGNDACVVLAEGIAGTEPAFVDLMNRQAHRLGLNNSHFGTANGWPDGDVTYVTARDLATLASATIEQFPMLYKRYYSKRDFTWGRTLGGKDITQANRDPLLGRVEGADGLKTGHTEEAGYSFTGSAEQKGRRLVLVLAGMTSWNQRVSESVSFMNWGFRAWKDKLLFSKGRQVGTANVQLGHERSVGLVAPRNLAVAVPSGMGEEVKATIVYNGPLLAPIKAGAHVADLVVRAEDMPPRTLPLVAGSDVGGANFLDRAMAGLRHLFGAL